MKLYKGTIVQESLIDDRILNEFRFLGFRVTNKEKPEERWHLFTVEATETVIVKLSKYIKPEKWYAHFWNGDNIIAIFSNKVFRFKFSDKSSWKEAVEYGKSIGIPGGQLDFLIDDLQ